MKITNKLAAIGGLLFLAGCGCVDEHLQVAKEAIKQSNINNGVTNYLPAKRELQPYVDRFLTVCGDRCNGVKGRQIELGMGTIDNGSTAGVCLIFDKIPKEIRPDRVLIVDRKFWIMPYAPWKAPEGEEDRFYNPIRYRLVSHELTHCYFSVGHREGGLMNASMQVTNTLYEVDNLIRQELDYIEKGGQYLNKNYDGSPTK